MRELTMVEVQDVNGGLDADTGALAVIAIGLCGGPLIAAAAVVIGLGILFR